MTFSGASTALVIWREVKGKKIMWSANNIDVQHIRQT